MNPTIELDAQGGQHMIYPAYAIGDAFYAYCPPAGCSRPEDVKVVKFETPGTVANAMIAWRPMGVPHVATVVQLESESGTLDLGAYFECKSNCDTEDGWAGLGLMNAYVDRNIARIDPAVALTLTPTGGARMVLLGENDAGVPRRQYLACDSGCDDISRWGGLGLVESENLGAGVDIALDGAGEAHVVFTVNSDIFEFDCKEDCFSPDEAWTLTPVERGSEMKPDEIIPYADCTVAAWFLRHPSVAADAQGHTYVVYRAEDISGGGTNHNDPNKPHCRAGVDATYARHRSLP